MPDDRFISLITVEDEEYWYPLKKKIDRLLDFDTSHYRDNFLKRRVECRLRHTGCKSYSEYMSMLDGNHEERSKLKKELTIHVTHFFRDKTLYRELRDWIFPQLVKEKLETKDHTLIVWSAGCSTGQEPYSLAIIIREVLGDDLLNWDIVIDATDIDVKTVEKAKEGIYDESSFIETDSYYRAKYFDKIEGAYAIKDDIKDMVNFTVGNINTYKHEKFFDLILCRNTVIYFERETKNRLYLALYKLLKPAGFLVLGKTEFLDGDARLKFEVYNNNERIYRKPKA